MPLLLFQFLAIALLLWPSSWQWPSWWAGGLMLLGLGLTLWSVIHNRPGNFRLRPEPQADGQLITSGPYAWMRHPMYVALLLMMAGVCGVRKTGVAIGAWVLLLVVLWLKARAEEKLLLDTFPEYKAYRARTRF